LSTLVLLCFVLIGIQILYLSFFLIAFSRKDQLIVQKPNPVSVIVCAHDEEQNLKELVPLLLEQDHPEFEIIIVEDRCNDGSYDYLLQATQEHTRLKMVRVVNKPEYINGKKFGITLGVRAAKYDWLLFTDADCRPGSKHWITAMTERYDANTQFVLGFSPYRKTDGLLNAFIRFESLLTGIQCFGMALLGKPYMGVGRNLVYTKSLFLQSKGFNNYLGAMGGDDDLFVNLHANKENTKVCVGQEATTLSTPKNSWSDFLDQKLRHLFAGKRYKFSDKMILGLFMISWLLTWFLVFPAIVFTQPFWVLLLPFLFRWALLVWLFDKASKRLGGQFEPLKTPLLDFIFPFYYLVTGLRALVVKRIRWKN
jgi:cellulose synthase/poly-beta-1,6-N-acetylglucosamine synthase-like glycosyltransferase